MQQDAQKDSRISVVRIQHRNDELVLNDEQVNFIRRMYCQKATAEEAALFIHVCRQRNLDPRLRQICMIKVGTSPASILTTIDGLRIIAERSGKYRGQEPHLWCGDDGVYRNIWIGKKSSGGAREAPYASMVGVIHADFEKPLYRTAYMHSYNHQGNWKKMPEHMLSKCAEALALRAAFPSDMSGLYTTEEMQGMSREEIEEATRSLARDATNLQEVSVQATAEPTVHASAVDRNAETKARIRRNTQAVRRQPPEDAQPVLEVQANVVCELFHEARDPESWEYALGQYNQLRLKPNTVAANEVRLAYASAHKRLTQKTGNAHG